MAASYQQKSANVLAMQWTGKNWSMMKKWFEGLKTAGPMALSPVPDTTDLLLQTQIGRMPVQVTDWIIANENGVVYMANDETFKDRFTYVGETLDPDGGTNENPLMN